MFQSAYQDGECVEVFSPVGKDPAAAWKLAGKVARLYDKGVKGYVLTVSGGATSKMQIPKAPKGLLGLRQRHLVLQVLTANSQDKPFSLELGLTDASGTRRRLVLSSSFRTLHCTPLHAQIPLVGLEHHRGSWANLSIDLAGLTGICFRADAFRTLDLLAIGPMCRIRKIFTMTGALHGTDEGNEGGVFASREPNDNGGLDGAPVETIPLRMAFPAGVMPPPRAWVISPSTLRCLASPEVPSPSPSNRTAPRTLKNARWAPSPRPSPLPRAPATTVASSPRIALDVRPSRGGTPDKRTPSPREPQSEITAPALGAAGRSSPAVRSRPWSVSSGVSSGNSAHAATPSPLSTPVGRSNPARRNVRIPSSSSMLVSSTRGDIGGRSVIAGSARRATTANTTPIGRARPDHAPSSSPGSSRVVQLTAVAFDGAVAIREDCDGLGTARHGLPARRRASETAAAVAATIASKTAERFGRGHAYLPGGCTLEARTEVQQQRQVMGDVGGSGGDRKSPASEEDWGMDSGWNELRRELAPVWSFNDGNGDSKTSLNGASASEAKAREYSFSSRIEVNGLAAAPPTAQAATMTPHGSYRSPPGALVSSRETFGNFGDTDQAVRYRRGQEQEVAGPLSRPLLASPETIPANTDVSVRKEESGVSAVASIRRSASPLRSSGAQNNQSLSRSRRFSSSSSSTAVSPAAFDTSSQPSLAVQRRKDDDEVLKRVATAARLFTPPVSGVGGQDIARRFSPSLGGTSRGTFKSPTSARVDVLQALLSPAAGDDAFDPRPARDKVAPGTEKERDGGRVEGTAAMAAVLEARGGGDGGDGDACGDDPRGESVGDGDALELLLLRNTTATSSGRSGTTTGTNAKTVDRVLHTITRRTEALPGVDNDLRENGVGTYFSRNNCSGGSGDKVDDLSPRQLRGSRSSVEHPDTGASGREVGSASPEGFAKERAAAQRRSGSGGSGYRKEMGSRSFSVESDQGLQFSNTDYLSRNERWRDKQEGAGGHRAALARDRPELDELERKEIALLDLEESYRTEFGSIDLSRSPETRALFTGDRSPAPMRTAGTGGDGPVKTNALVNRHSTGGSNPVTLIFSPRHARTSLYDSSDGGGDVDSVVFGSAGGGYGEGSPGSVVPPSAGSGRNTARNTKAPTQGQQGADETAIRQGGGGRDTSLRAGGDDDELYFDPVLNCYYDRAANKYYGLR